MKRSDNFSDGTFFKYNFPLREPNFSQKYLKSIFFNIGGITYRSPGHFAVFHEKIRQVFSYLERYRRSRRRPVYYSAFNTARVRRDLLYQCCTSVDLTVMSRRRRLYTTVYYWGPLTTVHLTLWEYGVTYALRISAKNSWNSFFFNIGVLAKYLPVILA